MVFKVEDHGSELKDSQNKIYNQREKEGSFVPTMIKISVGLFIGTLIVWFYFHNKQVNKSTQTSDSLVSDSTMQEVINGDGVHQEMITLRIEDPNEAPYSMFIGAYQNDILLFKLDLPDGELLTSTDSLIQIILPGQEWTNLLSETFSISVSAKKCTFTEDEIDWSKLTIGDIGFNKGITGDSGAGRRYSVYYYSLEKNDHCINFSLELESGNTDATDVPLAEFDEAKEVEWIETVLNTIKLNPK